MHTAFFFFSAYIATDLQNHGFNYWSEQILLYLNRLEGYPDLKDTKKPSFKPGETSTVFLVNKSSILDVFSLLN